MSKTPPTEKFPVSRTRTIKGTRHMAREKVLQILAATNDGEVSLDVAFPHIFYRQFTFDPSDIPAEQTRILKPDEVFELEADLPIEWEQEEIDYATNLILSSQNSRDESTKLVDEYATNWDLERIALLDRVLMHLAITELMTCPTIPVKVTINEVIELAKRYSTDKSGTFVNGILDAVVTVLQDKGRINKSGKGLIT